MIFVYTLAMTGYGRLGHGGLEQTVTDLPSWLVRETYSELEKNDSQCALGQISRLNRCETSPHILLKLFMLFLRQEDS
jgi:hypothetical protein